MLSRIRTWQVVAVQLVIGILSILFLAMAIHYSDVVSRPEPQSGKVLLGFLVFVSAGFLAVLAAGVRSEKAHTVSVVASTIVVWFLALYGLVFIWINTYGT
jgi:hypothetical protein